LLELTQWKSDAEVADLPNELHAREALEDECADVLLYLLLIADRAGIDLEAATLAKLAKNEAKYPVDRFKGSRRKYDAAE
jgi:NTP pyrophosphatase (non-canonical NTP hydrolase)